MKIDISKLKNNTLLGAMSTLFFSFLFILLFFGAKTFTDIDTNFLSIKNADLIKDVYTTSYSVKYDSTYVKSYCMNYPYGEHYKYTGNQVYISFPLKFLTKLGVENAFEYVLLLMNLFVVASIFLCSLFLFLLFKELKFNNLIAILGAVAITFLSPQLMRIVAHLTLSYLFIIPFLLLLLAKNYNKPRFLYVVLLGILLIFGGFSHPYYLIFIISVSTIYWLYVYCYEKEKFGGKWKILLFFSIQILLPLLLFIVLNGIGDNSIERSKIPNGFFRYQNNIFGLISPYNRCYPFKLSGLFPALHWEAHSYIGIVPILVLIVLLFNTVVKICKGEFRKLLKITDNNLLNVFFWSSLLLFLFSCGIPVNWFPKNILNYLGPLSQMRALGRFAWLFFYVVNIMSLYVIFDTLVKKIKNQGLRIGVTVITFSLIFLEVYAYSQYFVSRSPRDNFVWTDYQNSLAQNQWVHEFNPNKYQSILSLPVFCVGSENIHIAPEDDIFKKSVYVSFKTGLPLHSIFASRSNIKQTFNNLAFAWEPWGDFPVLKDLKSNKPLLVIKPALCESLNDNEKRILDYSKFLFSAHEIDFYQLEIDDLNRLCKDFRQNLFNEYSDNRKYINSPMIYSNDSLHIYYLQTWDTNISGVKFQGTGALEGVINSTTTLYDGSILFYGETEVSFWMSHLTEDLFPRSKFLIVFKDSMNQIVKVKEWTVAEKIKATSDGWGLVRGNVTVPESASKVHISVVNKEMRAKKVYFDNLLIRPVQTNVIFEDEHSKFFNNLKVLQ